MRLTRDMSPRFVAHALFQRRSYVLLWQRLRANAPWRREFWGPDAKIARAAEQHDALQKVCELTPLVRLLRQKKPETVVEIGSDRGGTFYAWCRLAAPDAVLVSIDLPGSATEAGTLRAYGAPGQAVHVIHGDSHAVTTRDELAGVLAGRRVDFLMIDGDHSYEGVKADYELYRPLVAHDGLIAFHDVVPHRDPTCKVDEFWDEVKSGQSHVEFVDPGDDRGLGSWGGIGVLLGPFEDVPAPSAASV